MLSASHVPKGWSPMSSVSVSAAALAELLELVARKIHSMGHADDLFPAQWMALRYFARAQMNMRTASELARFQGMALGPVTRTVRKLIEKGLLRKSAEQPRGRAEWLELTELGWSLLKVDPLQALEEAVAGLPEGNKLSLAVALETIVRQLSDR